MKITEKWLKKWDACREGVDWFSSQEETDAVKVIKKLTKEDK